MPVHRVKKTADLEQVIRNLEQNGSHVTCTEDDGDTWLIFTARNPRSTVEHVRGGS
jgi:hypothetical protein